MTAPDRIWLQHPMADEPDEPDWTDPDFEITWCSEPIQDEDVEYIRKGAFPVEEIQELVNYPERMIDYGSWTTSMQACLERILSLLEGDSGE